MLLDELEVQELPIGDVAMHPIEILIVEDNPGDVMLTREALRTSKIRNRMHVARDGEEGLAFLRREGPFVDAPRPDLVLLDLKLPRKSGLQVLAAIKGDDDLRRIPVVILTSSKAEEDIVRSYSLHANCYISKPVDFEQLCTVVRTIEDFWFSVVTLSPK